MNEKAWRKVTVCPYCGGPLIISEDGGGKIVDGNVIYPDNMLDWLQHPAEGEEDT